MSKLNKMFSIRTFFDEQELEQMAQERYDEDRQYPENFSNWYPKIEDVGNFKIAKVINNQIFTYENVKDMQATDMYDKVDWKRMNDILKPTLDILKPGYTYSIKNGCYSNKFDFNTCITSKFDLPFNLWKINYTSTMLDTGGYTELVVREYIPFDKTKLLTIYNGMPLRTEVRVFYNMDSKHIEYMVDYWDYNYCSPNIHNLTDSVVFKHFHEQLDYSKKLNYVMEYIQNNIRTLKFNKLTGIWSLDFMYVDDLLDYKGIWLIDMARGPRSAYWDSSRCKGVK